VCVYIDIDIQTSTRSSSGGALRHLETRADPIYIDRDRDR